MPEPRECPNCGAEIPVGAPESLCPKCLLSKGFALTTATDQPPAVTGVGPTIRYFGDYEIESEIARGGMGVVYKARQVTLNRPVAVKMILVGRLADDLAVGRFLVEAEAAANLKHPNIVAIHEVGEYEGQHYFSMDFIDGQNLAEWTAGKPIPAATAVTLVKTLAEAIHYAHQRGTLHRDLKPSNVMVDADDQPHITDFGLAKTIGSDQNFTQTGDVMGTPSYMSPEQASGRHDQIGPHSDVYALGVILYELLTGAPPFQSTSPLETLQNVIEQDRVAPRARNPAIPRDLEIICLKCLEKSPQRRYHSAQYLADDLDRFARHEPIHARPASTMRKVVSWARRHPGTLAATAALVSFGLAASVFYLAEENAFLRAQQASPELTRQPGPRTEALDAWKLVSIFFVLPGSLTVLWLKKRRQHWRSDPSNPERWTQSFQPIGHWLRSAATCLGVLMLCVSMIVLAKAIEAYVWEGANQFQDVLSIVYLLAWFGLWVLGEVLRDFRLEAFGAPQRELSAEQRDAIQRELLERGSIAALKRYRQVIPDAPLAEAKAYIDHLESEWRERDPQAYAAATPKWWNLNWRLMAICLSVEAAVLLALWVALPAMREASLGLAIGFLSGLLFVALPRLIATTKKRRTVIFVVAIVGLFASGVLTYYSPKSPPNWQWSFPLGVFCGASVLVSGFTPRRRESRQIA